MGNGKRDVRAFIIIIATIVICVYGAMTSISKDRESRGKTEAIQILGEEKVTTFELPDDSMHTLKEYINKIKEGVLDDK